MSLFTTDHIFDTGTSEAGQAQRSANRSLKSANNPKRAQTSTNENNWKSNERNQAVGTSTEHKQPQASTSKQTAEWEQTRWNEREQGQERGGRRRVRGRASEGNVVVVAAKARERARMKAGKL